GRGQLIQERREQVVVVPVDQQYVYRRVSQTPGAGEAGEPGPRDHHTREAHFSGGFRNLPPPPCRRLAILSSASAPPVASSSDLGSFCFFLITGSNRSPTFSTRLSTWSDSKTSFVGSPDFKQRSTSSHDTGVETVGRDRARSE